LSLKGKIYLKKVQYDRIAEFMDIFQWFPGNTNLSWEDYSLLLFLIFFSLFIGIFAGKKEENTQDFFLGSRKIPWWAACLSFVATEISAVTIISVPAVAFTENWQYAQFFIGSFLARVVIATLFIPAFYHYNCSSIYEFLNYRFGPHTQTTASIFFFITRLLASGVRLMAASLAVSVLIGWHILPTILLFSVVSMIYIAWGGIKAVIWTNVIQALTFILGGTITILFLLYQIEGGLSSVIQIAGDAGRLHVFNWGPSGTETQGIALIKKWLMDPNIFWIATLNGLFGSMAAFGTDQELMQRLLTVETRNKSQKTMMLTTLGSFAVLMIYLSIGSCLFAFYAQHSSIVLPEKMDKIFPFFIEQSMPAFMRGLMLSAIVMASIDSPLGSLTTSFVTDIYRPLVYKNGTEKHYLLVSRIGVIIFGIVLAAIAYSFSHFDKILWLAFKIGGVTYGSLLGIFLLGLCTKRRVNKLNIFAMGFSALCMLVLLILSEKKMIALGWSWLLIIGTCLTFAIGWLGGKKESESVVS